MALSDSKFIQAFVQKFLNGIIDYLELADTNAQYAKTKWQDRNPDPASEGSNLTAQDVTDANALIAAIKAVTTDHAAIIATLKAKDQPSHGTGALD